MKQYIVVNAPLFLAKGEVLQLSEEQATRRNGLINPLGIDTYELLADMHFKVGEVIGYKGELPKRLTQLVLETELEVGTYDPADILPSEEEDAPEPERTAPSPAMPKADAPAGETKSTPDKPTEPLDEQEQSPPEAPSLAPALPIDSQMTAKQVGAQLEIKAFPSLKALLKKIGIEIQNGDSPVPADTVTRARAELAKSQ
jgi:pyruvate/2-oxoglutarate dehydrogenase complex dihydrolipoamide acyltransferase (E2) component